MREGRNGGKIEEKKDKGGGKGGGGKNSRHRVKETEKQEEHPKNLAQHPLQIVTAAPVENCVMDETDTHQKPTVPFFTRLSR